VAELPYRNCGHYTMRVLHFYKTYFPDTFGGVEQMIFQLAEKSVSLGMHVDVLTLSAQPQGKIHLHNHTVYQEKLGMQLASTGFSRRAFSTFKSLVTSADIVHYHYPWPFMDVVHFLTRCRKPAVVSYHSDIVKQRHLLKLYRPLQRIFLNNVDCIVAESPDYLASSPILQRYRDKTTVIPIGLDDSTYAAPDEATMRRWKEKLPERFFLFTGVLRYYKGLHVLLEAMRGNACPVVIAGSGPEEHRLRALAQRWNLQHVYFPGRIPDCDKHALLGLCYGVVLPSNLRSEAFGISLLEGAMFGKPLISCAINTGTSFINVHETTGLVTPANDPQALSHALQFLWNHPDTAARMGRAARERYSNLFTADQMAAAYAKIYRALAQSTFNSSRHFAVNPLR